MKTKPRLQGWHKK